MQRKRDLEEFKSLPLVEMKRQLEAGLSKLKRGRKGGRKEAPRERSGLASSDPSFWDWGDNTGDWWAAEDNSAPRSNGDLHPTSRNNKTSENAHKENTIRKGLLFGAEMFPLIEK